METNFLKKSWRLKHLYKIVNKEGKPVGFIRNKAQELVAKTKKRMRKEKGNIRLIILKGRQLGITTDACVGDLDETMLKSNISCMITAHKMDKQKEIFKKVDYAYNHFPNVVNLKNGKVFKKRKTRLKNVNELFFKDNNSSIQVSLDARSGTYQILHITELAFRHDAEEMMIGTLPAIPPNGELVIETTANGVGNYFHKLWQENWNNPKASYRCIFLGWWLADEYKLSLEEGEIIQLPEELKHLNNPMVDGTMLSEEQKKRYLWMYGLYKVGKKKGSIFQEYPNTPDEAFLNTGDPVFDLNRVKNYATLPFTIDSEFKDLRIYRSPVYKYCMFGVDTAEGGENGDNASIRVRDENLNLLAAYYGTIEPDELCKVIDRLIQLGYIGRLGIERNNTGIATISKAKEYSWYSLIYQEKTVDQKTNRVTLKIGWHTNSKTRPILISDYTSLFKEGLLPNIDEPLRHEMYTFIFNDKKKPEASPGNHDDAIISDAICCYMRNFPILIDRENYEEE